LKDLNYNDPQTLIDHLKKIENMAGVPAIDLQLPENYQVKVRANEHVGPAMFKPDPFIPGGYIANSLTIRAMRPDIFVAGDSLEDLSHAYECACGKHFDVQFWKLCPYCARDIKL
jgi:hypothetical protein